MLTPANNDRCVFRSSVTGKCLGGLTILAALAAITVGGLILAGHQGAASLKNFSQNFSTKLPVPLILVSTAIAVVTGGFLYRGRKSTKNKPFLPESSNPHTHSDATSSQEKSSQTQDLSKAPERKESVHPISSRNFSKKENSSQTQDSSAASEREESVQLKSSKNFLKKENSSQTQDSSAASETEESVQLKSSSPLSKKEAPQIPLTKILLDEVHELVIEPSSPELTKTDLLEILMSQYQTETQNELIGKVYSRFILAYQFSKSLLKLYKSILGAQKTILDTLTEQNTFLLKKIMEYQSQWPFLKIKNRASEQFSAEEIEALEIEIRQMERETSTLNRQYTTLNRQIQDKNTVFTQMLENLDAKTERRYRKSEFAMYEEKIRPLFQYSKPKKSLSSSTSNPPKDHALNSNVQESALSMSDLKTLREDSLQLDEDLPTLQNSLYELLFPLKSNSQGSNYRLASKTWEKMINYEVTGSFSIPKSEKEEWEDARSDDRAKALLADPIRLNYISIKRKVLSLERDIQVADMRIKHLEEFLKRS